MTLIYPSTAPDRRRCCSRRPTCRTVKRTNGLGRRFALAGLLLWTLSISQAAARASDTEQIAATINGVPIYVAQVDHDVKQSLGDRDADIDALRFLKAAALQQLIRRQIVLAYLETRGDACTNQEVDLELGRLKNELARQEKTLENLYQSTGLNEVALRQNLRWKLSWKRYTSRYMTDKNLKRYFEQHRADFDGRKMRVAQILLKYPQADPSQKKTVVERAGNIRDEIVSGKVTFAEAARRDSQSPSAAKEGVIGWIERHEPMPEVFSRAAFQLEESEISPPVASPFGVHLIRCLEIEGGEKTWQQVRPALSAAVTQYLLAWTSSRPGTRREIQFTGATPHFKPGTRELAQPQDSKKQ